MPSFHIYVSTPVLHHLSQLGLELLHHVHLCLKVSCLVPMSGPNSIHVYINRTCHPFATAAFTV
jgi:hypothetical protein